MLQLIGNIVEALPEASSIMQALGATLATVTEDRASATILADVCKRAIGWRSLIYMR